MLPAAASFLAALAAGGGSSGIPAAVVAASAHVEVAVIDTGADVSVPAIASHRPSAYDVRTGTSNVRDANGHGTFVTSLVAEYGGDARILVVKAGSSSGAFTDQSESQAIHYAIAHGARIINLSIGGPSTSRVERAAIRFAVAHGALVVAAAGNDYQMGNPVEYPANLVVESGLVVAASDDGARAPFSGTATRVSLAAPGVDVYGAFGRGRYGRNSGTSFATAEVSGAAALVWAANPSLTAQQVARILEITASGGGIRTPALGFGVVDAPAAVSRAQQLAAR